MKVFFVLIRIITVGLVWSIFFLEGVRVIMLKNWRFDIIKIEHWQYAKDLWLSGWVISDAKEWAFVLILLTFIPLWLTGWAALSMVSYSKIFFAILGLPLKIFRAAIVSKTRDVKNKIASKTVIKKKSHKQTRPPARDGSSPKKSVMDSKNLPTQRASAPQATPYSATQAPKKESKSSFDHALFDFDTGDDGFDFDLDAPIEKPKPKKEPEKKPQKENKKPQPKEKEAPKKQQKEALQKGKENNNNNNNKDKSNGSSSIIEAIKEKGYDFASSITIKNSLIDFVAFSQEKIILLLVDKEHGDWLADEEKFNGEEPLWFSENSHRISPVRRVEVAREAVFEKLSKSNFSQDIEAIVINQMNNIINAEDMLEIWSGLDIKVTRIDRGTPKELPLFAKSLEEAEEKLSREDAEKLKKLLRGIN